MSEDATEEPDDGGSDEREAGGGSTEAGGGRFGTGRERIEEGADRAVSSFDEGVVDVLSWVLDTETRARIYVFLRQHPWSTSEEVAEGTGLYPSTVREALAELADEDKVDRRKRQSEGAGNNPYEYTAMAPSELVGEVVGGIQDQLNEVFNLDRRIGGEDGAEETAADPEPVRIEVEDGSDAPQDGGVDATGVDVIDDDGDDEAGDADDEDRP